MSISSDKSLSDKTQNLSLTDPSNSVEYLEETVSEPKRVKPSKPTKYMQARDTYVLCDIEDTSVIENLDPCIMHKRLEEYICEKKGGRYRDNSVAVFVENNTNTLSDELRDRYWEAARIRITLVPKGDKDVRIYKLFASMIFQAKIHRSFPKNMLVVTRNCNFLKDTKFSRVRTTLQEGGFYVDLAQFDELFYA